MTPEKDPISKYGHILRLGAGLNFGGVLFNPGPSCSPKSLFSETGMVHRHV